MRYHEVFYRILENFAKFGDVDHNFMLGNITLPEKKRDLQRSYSPKTGNHDEDIYNGTLHQSHRQFHEQYTAMALQKHQRGFVSRPKKRRRN